jgi:hypothetical protein
MNGRRSICPPNETAVASAVWSILSNKFAVENTTDKVNRCSRYTDKSTMGAIDVLLISASDFNATATVNNVCRFIALIESVNQA